MGPCRRVASRVRISATLREFTDHALQMAAHGQPGRVAIARHQRGEDALMVFLRGLAQFLRVEVLLDFSQTGPRAWSHMDATVACSTLLPVDCAMYR